MTLRVVSSVILFVVCYGIFLVWNTPAAWVINRVRPETARTHVTLGDVAGTAWHGSGELNLGGAHLGALRWNAQPWSLLEGSLRARIRLDGKGIQASSDIAAGRTAILLSHVSGEGDLTLVANLVGLPATLQGTLSADLKDAAFTNTGRLEKADGQIVAHGARLPQLGVSLGTITLALHSSQNQITGQLSNSGGELNLAGLVTLSPTGFYTLQATLKPHPGQNRLSTGLAALLGQPDAEGRYHIDNRGSLAR